jgi:hypothetical protein
MGENSRNLVTLTSRGPGAGVNKFFVVKKQVDPDVEFDDSGSGHKSRLLRPQ